MISLNFLSLALVLVILFESTLHSLAERDKPTIVQPSHTLSNSSASSVSPNSKSEPSAAQKIAKEIQSKPPLKDEPLQYMREKLLHDKTIQDDTVQLVRDGQLLNALHEAIDEKIVDQSFIQTLASVGEPPLISDYTRDTLLIKSIKEDVNFTFGEDVFAWKTLVHENKDQHIIVGLSKQNIVILYEHFGEYTLQQVVPMETVPTAFEVITVWDTVEDKAVSCLVVATELSLIWYSMRSKANFALTEEWRWPLHKTTTLIKCFKYKDIHMILLVGTHPNRKKSVSATLYEFDFEQQQFWLMQKLALNFPCKMVGLVNVDSEFLVAFPQNNTAMIYTLDAGEKYRGKFSLIANFTSEQINTVGAFQIGRYAYVAIGGKSPQILRYANGQFTSQNVPTHALETVEAFFEVPTRTYRDDLILLVQHTMTFSTHELQRLEVLVWNGESFDIRSNIPCFVDEMQTDNEVSCLLDLERPTGILGSTIIQRGKQVSMIVPRYKAHSSLFHLEIVMLSEEHPITQKINEIRETIQAFTKIIEYQDSVINQALQVLAEASVLRQPLVLLQNCSFQDVYSTVAYQHKNLRWPNDQITIGNVTWTYEDTAVDIPAIEREIEYEKAALVQLEHRLKFAVRKHNESFSLDLQQPLHVQGHLEIDGSLVADDLYVRRLEEEPFTIRTPRQADALKELHLKDLQVRYLNFDVVNGVPANELVFNSGDKIELTEKLVFEDSVVAENVILPKGGTVDGVDLSESTVYFNCKNRRWNNLKFDYVEVLEDVSVKETVNGMKLDWDLVETKFREASAVKNDVLVADKLKLNGSLYFETINGIPWNDIIQRVVLKNRPNRLPELRIEGDLILDHPNITVFHLNELAFPDDYLFSNSHREAIVTGEKHFVNKMSINALFVDSTVNGVDLGDIITLDTHQHIPGNITIEELHVSERLQVKGSLRGKHLDAFLDNPTLLQSSKIKAACHFDQLHVDGPIIVKESMNGADLDTVLKDVVYNIERNVKIESIKRIGSAEFQGKVKILSKMVNEFTLDEFVTRSTDQELNVTEIGGNIFFEQLELDGLFDELNATEVDLNSIKLHGEQYTDASLVIKNPKNSQLPDVQATELHIGKKLNSRSRTEYLDTEADELVITGQITMNQLDVKNLYLEGSTIEGPTQTINNVHLPTFDNLRFSLTRPQQIAAPFHIDKVTVDSSIVASYLNSRDFRNLQQELNEADNLMDLLLLGKIPVENLYVEGDLQVKLLNDVNFDALLQNVIWLDRPNTIPGTIRFLDPLMIADNLTTHGLVNEINFQEFLGDVVRKSAGVAEFFASKTFSNGFVIEENINTVGVNNIRIKELALKNQTIYLRGDVEIDGTLFVDHLHIGERLNGDTVNKLVNLYHYNETTDTHVIKGDVYFNNKASIKSLQIRGSLNHIPNVDDYLRSLIRKDQNYTFTKPILFKNEVLFEKGFTVTNLNGYNIANIQNEIVRINEPSPVELIGEVVFAEPVYGTQLTIQGDLIAPNVAGCNPDYWARNAIMINKDLEIFTKTVFTPGTLKIDHIKAAFINGFPLDKLITLNTPQTIEAMHIYEMTIDQALEVGGLINGVNFPYERQNTLMTYGTQRIRIPTVFNSIRVLNSLTLPPVLNGKPFGSPVLLGPKVMIESPISFRHLKARSLETEDMISGVDFNQWYKNSLWRAGRDRQVIHARVQAGHVQFKGTVAGNGMINGVDIKEVIERMKLEKKNVENQLHDYQSEMRALCSSAKDLVDKSKHRMFFFKYFVQRQVINEHQNIQSFHFFDHMGHHFLAVNLGCDSHFYQWDPIEKAFVPVFVFQTGLVEEWITVLDREQGIYLVTRSSSEDTECKTLGLSVWLVLRDQLQPIWNAADAGLVQAITADPLKTESFYALKGDLVMEFALAGSVLEQWNLPKSVLGYRFVPNKAGLGLAVSDGKLLVLLSNVNKTDEPIRTKRESNETVGMAMFSTSSMYDRMANHSSERIRSTLRDSWEITDAIEPDDVKPKEYDRLDNGSLVHVNEQAPLGSPAYRPIHIIVEDEDSLPEETVAKNIPLGGIFTADNPHFPERAAGEIIAFQAGPHNKKRQLVAVSAVLDTVIKGDHDAIKIYIDIQTGKLYQVLPCYRPSHLTTLELRDETILVFLEILQTVQIYIYRGMQGFVRLNSFKLAAPAIQMSAVSLPQRSVFKCKLHYLAIATEQQELVLLKAKTQGNCGISAEVDCDMD